MTDAERQDMTCATCVWFRPHDESDEKVLKHFGYSVDPKDTADLGQCRRSAPCAAIEASKVYTIGRRVWPLVRTDEWCGEWRPK